MRFLPIASACLLFGPYEARAPFEPQSVKQATAPSGMDLSRERKLVLEAQAAVKAVDLAEARAKSGEAIALLLAQSRSGGESEGAWLELLDTAGRVALEAQDPSTARAAWGKALEVLSRTLPDDHQELQAARLDLAAAIKALGDLQGARALEEKVLEVRSRTLPDDHSDLQKARLNLGSTMHMLGDFAGARTLFEKVLQVRSRTSPEDDPDLQVARGNLAVVLNTLGDFEGARALEEKVLEVLSRTLADDHPYLQSARLNLAATIKALGDLQGARALEEMVLEVRSRTLPDDHPGLQRARLNLASTMYQLYTPDDLAGARALYEKVLEVGSRTLPDDHRSLQNARVNLATTIAACRAAGIGGEEEEEKEEFTRLTGSFTRAIARSARLTVLTASIREAEERCANSIPDLGRALSFAEGMGVFEDDAGLEREAFVLSEETRGAALASAHLSRRARSDERYGRLRAEVRAASDDLAGLAQRGAGADELDAARARRERADRELALLARELSAAEGGLLDLDPSVLSKTLSEREALVGYRRYTRRTHEPREGFEQKMTESLGAFVLRSGARLEFIELGPIVPIERAVERWRQAIGVRLERGIDRSEDQEDPSVRCGDALRGLVFDPLAGALEGADRLVVALDDVLHLVSLEALPLDSVAPGSSLGSSADSTSEAPAIALLGDRWRIETRCTLSELLWKEIPVPRREALLALGGASFNSSPLPLSAEESAALDDAQPGSTEVAPFLRGGAWERGFEPLTHSGPEARGIAALYGEAFDEKRPAVVLEKRKASRAALAELAPKARFLHIATHGWFVPESVRSIVDPEPLDEKMGFGARMSGEERVKGMSPMLLCGLALAGANLKEDEFGRAPGLITAEELSTLDLSGCELAVLSACDTNVGERRAGQGVASFQKALQVAGARSVITSLWKVPDEATKDLMLDLYRRIWIERKPKWQALWEAKSKIRDAKDEAGKPKYSTRDWAAWVLTGDPN